MKNFTLILFAFVVFSFQVLGQQNSNFAQGPHIEVRLIHEQAKVVPGEILNLGVLFSPEQDWHTYWRNPGDSGEAPTINWSSSQALEFDEIQWPVPYSISVAHLVNYGFEGENLLMVPVQVPATLNQEAVEITADISWLVCKEDCIPGWATLSIELPVSSTNNSSANELSQYSTLFETAKQQLPDKEFKQGVFEVNDEHIVFEVQGLSQGSWQVFPFRSDVIDHAADQQSLNSDGALQVVAQKSLYFDNASQTLDWLIKNENEAFYVQGKLNGVAQSSQQGLSYSLWIYVIMAMAGGIILNLMPCVLPILSIKVMALQHHNERMSHKLAYMFGIAVCFNLFALIIVGLQMAGQKVGWGFHMQEPAVIILLAFLFTFIALVLFDVLLVGVGLSGVGQSLVQGQSAKSHFATGALAVIVASPCTAPFMATAIGVAMVSDAYITFILFNALAFGFALPLTVLFMSKRAASCLPKPGAWMETFKRFLGFPMLATVAWLCWVYSGLRGADMQFLLFLCLILFALIIWLYGQSKLKTFGRYAVLLCALLTVFVPIYLSHSPQQSDFIDYDKATLQSLREQNQVVMVNMTADWCITCKVNEQVAFASEDVKALFKEQDVHYMVGDWTDKNDSIYQFLTQYDRAGVPLYVVYAGNKNEQVLPQILSPNMVINAINSAKKELDHEN